VDYDFEFDQVWQNRNQSTTDGTKVAERPEKAFDVTMIAHKAVESCSVPSEFHKQTLQFTGDTGLTLLRRTICLQ